MKRLRLIVSILFLVMLCGCTARDNGQSNDADGLITKKYSVTEIEQLNAAVINGDFDFTEFEAMFTVECLRETHQGTYVILMREDGHKVFVFFDENGISYPVDIVRFTPGVMVKDSFATKDDFTVLVNKEAVMSEILAADPYGIYIKYFECTIHIIQEGVLVIYYAQSNSSDELVADINRTKFYGNEDIPSISGENDFIRDYVPYILTGDKT